MKVAPKFYKNCEDDNHCLQAALMMVLNTLEGDVSWDDVNDMTQFQDGLWSWAVCAVVPLSGKIPGSKLKSRMDYIEFAKRGEEYYREWNISCPEWFKSQKDHASDGFIKEQKAANEAVNKNFLETRSSFNQVDLEQLLCGNLLIALIDAGKLAGNNQGVGHWVVVYAQDNNNFLIHDPGLPPNEGWSVAKQNFMGSFQGDVIVVPNSESIPFGQDMSRNQPCWCGSGKKYKRCHMAKLSNPVNANP